MVKQHTVVDLEKLLCGQANCSGRFPKSSLWLNKILWSISKNFLYGLTKLCTVVDLKKNYGVHKKENTVVDLKKNFVWSNKMQWSI